VVLTFRSAFTQPKMLLLFVALAQFAGLTLPNGVTGVSFGKAQRYKDAAGKEMCAIVEPRATNSFDRGVTEITYGVALQPRAVKTAATRVTAPAGQELHSTPCNVFTPVKGGFSQTQLGSTISRVDKRPLVSGEYRLRITVDGQIADVPFSIR
jgi:hypothetical protein